MKITMYSTEDWDREFFSAANAGRTHEFDFLEAGLDSATAGIAAGSEAVCCFVHDQLDAEVLATLKAGGTHAIALRCAGFNNVDLEAAESLGMTVVRVPEYSPAAVAEHAVALILALNRNIHRAWNRVREGNFALKGLLGFDLNGRTVGIVGGGRIGACVARILHGFGCRLLVADPSRNPELEPYDVEFVDVDTLLKASDIITLHCPLTPDTRHLIDARAIELMKPGVMLINTSRGAVVDTRALIAGLKSRHIGHLGLDVYEQESDIFFQDFSDEMIEDDTLARLLTFPNVLITSHQGFFTTDALEAIADTTLTNLDQLERGEPCENTVLSETHLARAE